MRVRFSDSARLLRVIHWTLQQTGGMLNVWPKMPTFSFFSCSILGQQHGLLYFYVEDVIPAAQLSAF